MPNRQTRISKITIIGGIVNLLLVVFKFLAGIFGHSSAMIADAFHALSDLGSDIVVLYFIHTADKPEDHDHNYGHGKYETFASMLIGILLAFVGIGILADGCNKIVSFYKGEQLQQPNGLALAAAVVSIICKEGLYKYTIVAANRIKSQLLAANAWHHRSDALTSVAALLGIGGAMLSPKWSVLDPLACVLVSIFIVREAIGIIRPCMDELVEKCLPEKDLLGEIITGTPGVVGYHRLRTRKIGANAAVDVHVKMDGNITLKNAHDIASNVEKRLKTQLGHDAYINIHMEPV